MKTTLKQSFLHVFRDGDANTVEIARVFIILAIPVCIAICAYMLLHHVK